MSGDKLEFSILGSGSGGNAMLISAGRTTILVDAGFSMKELARRLKRVSRRPADIDAVILTHEHSDHIGGVGTLSKALSIPLYLNCETLRAGSRHLGSLRKAEIFETGSPFEIDGLRIEPFSLPHDAADPVGLIVSTSGRKMAILTDLGSATHLVREKMKEADALVLEANHDLNMLNIGPYPWELKQRIRGRMGHLSNDEASALLKGALHGKLRHVVLAHLSEINNHPRLAKVAAAEVLKATDVRLDIALQDDVIGPFTL